MGRSQIKTFLSNLPCRSRPGENALALLKKWADLGSAELTLQSFPLVTKFPDFKLNPWGFKSYLPLEDFRRPDLIRTFFAGGERSFRVFKSSGTTSRDRAESPFSVDGLTLYEGQAIAYFAEVMEAVLGLEHYRYRGLSLIPTTSEWPDSSLAQMTAWIKQHWPLDYIDDPKGLRDKVQGLNPKEPVWIFGTAFHFVNLIDQGFSCRLPEGSIIIETGGTKGKSREVTREEFYDGLSQAFAIDSSQIVSEYGMAELACQAYDFVPRGEKLPLAERHFRFPPWVKVFAVEGLGELKTRGQGALCLYDPLRIDFNLPFRTQDLAEVYDDQSFILMGRVPKAILKGCSLKAEELLAPKPRCLNAEKMDLIPLSPDLSFDQNRVGIRIKALDHCLKELWQSKRFINALAKELGSEKAASFAAEDLLTGLPLGKEAWKSAILKSFGAKGKPLGKSWLLILPRSHPVVGFYPLAIAYLAGFAVVTRLPENFSEPQSSLGQFIEALKNLPDGNLKTISSEFRIGEAPLPHGLDAILCYADDLTLGLIQSQALVPVIGFGTSVSLSVLSTRHLDVSVPALIKDALSLGQRGCLSSRAVIVTDPVDCHFFTEVLAPYLQSEAKKFWEAPLPTPQRVALDHEEVQLSRKASLIYQRKNLDELVVPLYLKDSLNEMKLEEVLSPQPMVLPIIASSQGLSADEIWGWASYQADSVRLLTIDPIIHFAKEGLKAHSSILVRPLGRGNSPLWDGTHEGKPLFSLR